jgi:hypothetical protein
MISGTGRPFAVWPGSSFSSNHDLEPKLIKKKLIRSYTGESSFLSAQKKFFWVRNIGLPIVNTASRLLLITKQEHGAFVQE